MCETCGWRDSLERIAEVKAMLEELPEKAEDFAASCLEKLEGIADWIDEKQHVTERQREAIENIAAAAERWQR